jgi:hypothetical protein
MSSTLAISKNIFGKAHFWLVFNYSNCSHGAQWVPHHAWNRYQGFLYHPGLVNTNKHHDHIHGGLQWVMRMLRLLLCKYFITVH